METRFLPMPGKVRTTEELVRRHQRGLWRHLRFLGAPPGLADDLTQETFLALLRRPPEDRGDDALGAWLRGTARNLFRSSGRAPRPGVVLADEQRIEDAWVALESHDRGDARRAALDACLQRLDGRARHALELRYSKGASREQMGRELGVSPEGVKTLLRRIRDELRRCIERRIGDGGT